MGGKAGASQGAGFVLAPWHHRLPPNIRNTTHQGLQPVFTRTKNWTWHFCPSRPTMIIYKICKGTQHTRRYMCMFCCFKNLNKAQQTTIKRATLLKKSTARNVHFGRNSDSVTAYCPLMAFQLFVVDRSFSIVV